MFGSDAVRKIADRHHVPCSPTSPRTSAQETWRTKASLFHLLSEDRGTFKEADAAARVPISFRISLRTSFELRFLICPSLCVIGTNSSRQQHGRRTRKTYSYLSRAGRELYTPSTLFEFCSFAAGCVRASLIKMATVLNLASFWDIGRLSALLSKTCRFLLLCCIQCIQSLSSIFYSFPFFIPRPVSEPADKTHPGHSQRLPKIRRYHHFPTNNHRRCLCICPIVQCVSWRRPL